MKNSFNQLGGQLLDAIDQMNALSRELRVDQFGLFTYNWLLNEEAGEFGKQSIDATGVFWRAYENMAEHLIALKTVCGDLHMIYEEFLKLTK